MSMDILLMSIYYLHDFNDHWVTDIVLMSTTYVILMTMTWYNDQRHCSDVSIHKILVYAHCSNMSTILYLCTHLIWCVLTFLLCIPMWSFKWVLNCSGFQCSNDEYPIILVSCYFSVSQWLIGLVFSLVLVVRKWRLNWNFSSQLNDASSDVVYLYSKIIG